jgi:hypothetical protein
MRRDPRLRAKYFDFRFQEFALYLARALDPNRDDPYALTNAIGHARTAWAAALRLTAADRADVLALRRDDHAV